MRTWSINISVALCSEMCDNEGVGEVRGTASRQEMRHIVSSYPFTMGCFGHHKCVEQSTAQGVREMVTSIRRPAVSFHWLSPSDEPCTLTPMSGGQGMLEVEIMGGMAIVHSRNCLYIKGAGDDAFHEIGEFEMTICLSRCEIHWHYSEKSDDDSVERSMYFTQ